MAAGRYGRIAAGHDAPESPARDARRRRAKATVMSTASTLTRPLWPTVSPDGSDVAPPGGAPLPGVPWWNARYEIVRGYPWQILRVIHRRSGGSGLDG